MYTNVHDGPLMQQAFHDMIDFKMDDDGVMSVIVKTKDGEITLTPKKHKTCHGRGYMGIHQNSKLPVICSCLIRKIRAAVGEAIVSKKQENNVSE